MTFNTPVTGSGASQSVAVSDFDAAINAAVAAAVAPLTAALATKAPIAAPTFTGAVAGVTKAHVGLNAVDNTSDAGKPVSTAQAAALLLKADAAATTAALAGKADAAATTAALAGKADAAATTAALAATTAALAGKADAAATTAALAATTAALAGKADAAATTAALASKADAAATTAALSSITARLGSAGVRPGRALASFVTQPTGAPGDLIGLDAVGMTSQNVAGLGECAVVTNAARIVAPREAVFVHPGRVYLAYFAARRLVDTPDPAGDTLRYALRALDADYAGIALPVVQDRILSVADGIWRRAATFSVGAPTFGSVDIELASNTVSVRPFIQAFSAATTTAFAQIEILDITEAALIDGALNVLTLAQAVVDAEAARDDAEAARDAAEGFAAASGKPYANYAAFLAATVPAGVTLVSFFDAAGKLYELSRDATGPITQGNGQKWKPGRDVFLSQFASVTQAAAHALLVNQPSVEITGTITGNPVIAGRSNLFFEGKGSFAGTNENTNTYRRQVTPPNALPAVPAQDPWDVRVKSRAAINVVLVGDSLSTYGANTLSANDGFALRLAAKLRADNPGTTINFFSRAIGAQTYTTLDALPSVGYPIADRYPWYTDAARAWLDYVSDLSPDLVILAFGMNDQASFDRAELESVVTKITAFASKPEIAFVTNMAPSLSPHPDNASFGSYAGQEGRDYAAGWIRTYALFNRRGLIDLNRTFGLMRDGRDILNTYQVEHAVVTFGSPSEYLAATTQQCRDFAFRAVFDVSAWRPVASANPLSIALSTGTNNYVFINDNAGFLQFRFYRGGVSSLHQTIVSTTPTPVGDVVVEVTVKNGEFTFRIVPATEGPDAGIEPFRAQIIRYGGLFRPAVSFFGGGGTGPVKSMRLFQGVETPCMPTITDLDLWGTPTSDTGASRFGTAGNGVNHPTSAGAARIYGAHLAQQSYGLINRFEASFAIGQYMFAQIDGTDSIGFGNTVDGARLLASNVGLSVATAPAGLIGTLWKCLGRCPAAGTASQRTTLWQRVE